ncbi:EAL domain-containing protein [Noviherbaspirillum saxi]|nr:EAL domain-containing protein [Noviherbaspirillum saxi]
MLGATYFTLVIQSEIKFHSSDLQDRLNYEIKFMTPALAEPAVVGDYSLIQQMLDVRVRQPHIVRINWVDNRGNRIESAEDDVRLKAPPWFQSWLNLPPVEQSEDIVVGGQTYGRVELRLTAVPAINNVWASLQDKLEVLLLCIGMLFAITLATVGNALRPLYALGAAARRFGQGDHSVRMTPSGPPEMIACVQAFNSMAENIETLLRSVSETDARNKMLALIVEQSSVAIITTDRHGMITSWNAAATELYRWTAEEAIGRSTDMLMPPGTGGSLVSDDANQSRSIEVRHRAKDGGVLDIFANTSPLYDGHGVHMGEIIVIRDITRQKQAEEALFKETERAQVTLASIADAVITTDTKGNVEFLNPVAEKLLGWSSRQAHGKLLGTVFRPVIEATGEPIENSIDKLVRDPSSDGVREDAVLVSSAGGQIPIQLTGASISDRNNQVIGAVLVFRDVSTSHSMARQLTWQATHDALTSLVNRREFARILDAMVDSAEQEGREHALLYMDLDQFKIVNDTCGHLAGDELLRQLSALLNNRVRTSDTLARLGGDEFGVLLKDCKVKQAMDLAEILRATVSEFRFAWQDKLFTVGVSIGVVAIKGDGNNPADILALADAACYQAKDNGRNRVEAAPHDKEMAHRRSEMLWVSKLTNALEQDRLVLYCQDIAPIKGGRRHCEVLLRMLDDDDNLVLPMAFIPAAERYNMMHAIDRKVIAMVFDALERRPEQHARDNPITVSINLSGISLSDENLLAFLRQQFARRKVRPRDICFEVTETAAIANLTHAVALMKELKAMGCSFSLDDFGSGLSSFAYLKNLPVDYLKIDGSFVRDMADDPIDAAMVQAISDIGHVMGIKTIAEWVENDTTLGMLKKIGVDYAQGYLISRPRPIEDVLWANRVETMIANADGTS